MKNSVNLYLVPWKIDAEEWKKTYWDAMKISKAGQLSELTVITEDGVQFYCNTLSESRFSEQHESHYWHANGDLHRGKCMEDFELWENIEYYIYRIGVEERCDRDVLEENIHDPEGFLILPGIVSIWGGELREYLPQKWLLAMACLVCHRFPEAATLGGDIRYEDCVKAVNIANQYLDEKIELPVICNKDRLRPRIKGMSQINYRKEKDLWESIYLRPKKETDTVEERKYTIFSYMDFYLWNEEATIDPETVKIMHSYMDILIFFKNERWTKFQKAPKHERLVLLRELYHCGIIMNEMTCKKIFANIMDDAFMEKYIKMYLYAIHKNADVVWEMTQMLILNDDMLDYYWKAQKKGAEIEVAKGRVIGVRECLMGVLNKFDNISETLQREIQKQEDSEILLGWIDIALKASSIEAFAVKAGITMIK